MNIPKTMKAAVLHRPECLTLEEVPVPEIADDEVLIQVKACGVCGSDVLALHGGHPRATYPRILGHEFSGIVCRTGAKAKKFAVGTRVTATMEIQCGQCWACRHGHLNHCQAGSSIGFSTDGGMGEYMKAPERNVLRLPENIGFEVGAIGETLAVGYNAIRLKAKAGAGDVVAIIGAGPVGMDVLACAHAAGCYVIISDVYKSRLEIAKKMGADRVVCTAEEDMAQVVRQVTNGWGVDVAVETVGITAARTVFLAVEITRPRGTVVIMGTNAQNLSEFPVTTFKEKEMSMLGSRGIPFDALERALMLLSQGRVDLNPVITHRFPLSQIHEAIRISEHEKAKAMKVMITY
ncbi:MAG: alcohol dehydrogenase catalytic domain-containing protein [Candidatus Korobacteraceae bacterium]|jgi:threonine dehydrogenase-like Zn-dependent dehydrogenase